ncbi:hypothetical protein [Rhodobaculum claviforme]|uniref:VPLPA-CTERM protein sorting domain-containing protein n=1 Tax=Rhodobaculum claviforme TaxID=1549854 RepID=A0A934TI48_9RHOB|nr:hypothetical protein [Rhodobaculum claviforme]MBK5926614.1 hypothetical protein [Rhodobaculum claviforme]
MLATGLPALLLSATTALASTTFTSENGSFTMTGAFGIPGISAPSGSNVLPAAPTTPAGQTITQENFESFTPGTSIDNTTGLSTSVGVFNGIGGTGSGNSAQTPKDEIKIQTGDYFGRFNVLDTLGSFDGRRYTATGNFLDSNDTNGFSWTITNNPLLRSAWAFITDPNDAQGQLRVEMRVDGAQIGSDNLHVASGAAQPNGQIWLFETDFANLGNWNTVEFRFSSLGPNGESRNDGVGLSNPTISAIPLPAPALMLLSGLGALGGLSIARRRRETAKA